MNKIKGIYAASMSILNKNLSLNIDRTILHAESLIDQGCHGVVIFGSTGQAQLISVSEKIDLLNQLNGWIWDPTENKWQNAYKELINYIKSIRVCIIYLIFVKKKGFSVKDKFI